MEGRAPARLHCWAKSIYFRHGLGIIFWLMDWTEIATLASLTLCPLDELRLFGKTTGYAASSVRSAVEPYLQTNRRLYQAFLF